MLRGYGVYWGVMVYIGGYWYMVAMVFYVLYTHVWDVYTCMSCMYAHAC